MPSEIRLLAIQVTIQTELLQADIYSQNSDHVRLHLDADALQPPSMHGACYVLSVTVIGTAPNCNTNKC